LPAVKNQNNLEELAGFLPSGNKKAVAIFLLPLFYSSFFKISEAY